MSLTKTATTHGIRVSVESFYLPHQSVPQMNQFVFAYRINIKNESDTSVQLLRRHWYIFDSSNEKREVEGEGVVGQQPLLESGQGHEYVSGCTLHTPIGRMHGTYQMVRVIDGQKFEVEIPAFLLTMPAMLN